MKTVIELLYDPHSGSSPVLALMNQLEMEGQINSDALQVYRLIVRGFEFLEIYGLDYSLKNFLNGILEDGRPYTIRLVKMLRDHVPLVEFRVNWNGIGAFRAVFFEYVRNELQILVFPRAIIKQATYDPEFERIVVEAKTIYDDFLQSPEKYITFEGGVGGGTE